MNYAAVCLALALCIVSMSSAEDKGLPGNYEHLKPLEPLLGTWTGEFVSPNEWPTANIKKGDKIAHPITYKRELNKSAIALNWTMGVPGAAPVWQSAWLIGWDTSNKRIVGFAFETTGGHQVIDDWEIQGDKVTAKGKGSDPFGRKTTFTMVISDIKKDSCTWQMIDVTMDGKKQPEFAKVPLKRAEGK